MKTSPFYTEKARFVIVGCMNTAIDFGILFALTFLGVDKIIANYFSTGIALIFSFFANRSFTFQDSNSAVKKQLVPFILVTLIGLWVMQPIILWCATTLLSSAVVNEALRLFIAKIIATIFSLIWNYFLYSRVVFKK